MTTRPTHVIRKLSSMRSHSLLSISRVSQQPGAYCFVVIFDIAPQVQIDPLIEGDRVAVAAGLPVAGDTRLHQKALLLIVIVRRNFGGKCRTRTNDGDPFCQDEKTRLPAEMLRLDS